MNLNENEKGLKFIRNTTPKSGLEEQLDAIHDLPARERSEAALDIIESWKDAPIKTMLPQPEMPAAYRHTFA